jgi:C4-dicarboxylate-specific signal transduction histidine kinase
LRDFEMAFLGKIAASMTHEIKNTYAIILESSGLLSDLLTFHQEGSFPHKEKFHKVLGTINEQVNRGVVIATRLNQFAHSTDEPLASVKIADTLELVVALMQRLARRRGIELKALAPDREVFLMSDPFRLQLVLASVIEQLADALEFGGKIMLQAPPAPQGVTIFLEAQGTFKPGWEASMENLFASLKDFLKALGAELAITSPPALKGVLLTIKAPGS